MHSSRTAVACWTLAHLLVALLRGRPAQIDGPVWGFTRGVAAISTAPN